MKIGVLWFPGWTATTADLEEMIAYLETQGIESYTFNLEGHNTQPEDLYGVKYQAWIKQAEQAYQQISREWDCVFVGGVSIGGQLALYLAHKYPVQGIISIGTPLRLQLHPLTKLLSPLLQYLPFQIKKDSSFPDEKTRQISLSRRGAYATFPISSAMQVYFLTRKTRHKYLRNVTSPILCIQSRTDHLLSSENIEMFYATIQSRDIELIWVEDSYHIPILDYDKVNIFTRIYQFIQKYSMMKTDNT